MVQKRLMLLVAICFIFNHTFINARDNQTRLNKPDETNISFSIMDASNWAYWLYANGKSAQLPNGSFGGIYPYDIFAGVIYADGLMWGGKFGGKDDDIRLGGGYYSIGTVGGWIKSDGLPISSDDPRAKVWRIRKDYNQISEYDIRQDAMYMNDLNYYSDITDEMLDNVIAHYQYDWENWPVDLGAPFYDLDNDGVYEPDANGDGVKWNSSIDEKPGIANADQVIWLVYNDFDEEKAESVAGSKPLGLEIQLTAWTYAERDEKYGQTIFKKFKVINKSGENITDMYLAQWSDPDIGNAGDDFVGCDTLLNMGFGYTAFPTDRDFDSFGMTPPAVGYDILQGPLVDGIAGEDRNKNGVDDGNDFGERNFQKVGPGKINLPMTSFGWFGPVNPPADPDLGEYDMTLQFYNMMQGFLPTDDIASPTPWRIGNIDSNATTKYPMAGDPVTGMGDIDGQNNYYNAGDRRMILSSGPFDLAKKESQEIVIAVVGGLGDDNLNSIAEMKANDAVAQSMWDEQFTNVPQVPMEPPVVIKGFENKILIEWGSNWGDVHELENKHSGNFEFEGYNVYQFSKETGSDIKMFKIATFDRINGITGNMDDDFHRDYYWYYQFFNYYNNTNLTNFIPDYDSGICRYEIIDRDYFTQRFLYEGKTYYYGVTAYSYNHNPVMVKDTILVSPMKIHAVTVQGELPGIRYHSQPGDMLEISPTVANIQVKVIDPSVITGHQYEIFYTSGDDNEIRWNVRDLDRDIIILSNQTVLDKYYSSDDQPIFDGLQVKVAKPVYQLSDTYSFGTPTIETNEKIAKEDVKQINVFPNPYYAHNDLATHRYENFVTFTHLPENAVIRIFNLSGTLVRVIRKNDPSQFYKWDLCNERNLLVGSGLYIAHITLPDINEKKILKICIVQKQL